MNAFGGGANLALMRRLLFSVTLQASGASVTATSQPLQPTVPPLAGGVALISSTVPALKLFEQVPDRVTRPPANVTVQLMPPRFDVRVPLAVLVSPVRVRVLF